MIFRRLRGRNCNVRSRRFLLWAQSLLRELVPLGFYLKYTVGGNATNAWRCGVTHRDAVR